LKTIREIVLIILTLMILTQATAVLSEAVLPYRDGYGCLWRQYVLEDKNSIDIMFFGSSLAYAEIIPAVIYDETGYTSYVMAGPQLTVKQTYYYMKEAFLTQSPKLVFLETSGMFFGEFTDYSRINISYMPYYSINRVKAAFLAAEPEERLGILFPLYNYHDRWVNWFDGEKKDEMGKVYAPDLLAGYMLLRETVAQDEKRERELIDYSREVYEKNLEILQKIIDLCEKKGIEVVLYQSPMYKPLNDEYYDMIKTDAEALAAYYDFNAQIEEMGFDMEADFYDIFHLNYKGAIKFTKYLVPVIMGYDIEKAGHNEVFWQTRARYFEDKITI